LNFDEDKLNVKCGGDRTIHVMSLDLMSLGYYDVEKILLVCGPHIFYTIIHVHILVVDLETIESTTSTLLFWHCDFKVYVSRGCSDHFYLGLF